MGIINTADLVDGHILNKIVEKKTIKHIPWILYVTVTWLPFSSIKYMETIAKKVERRTIRIKSATAHFTIVYQTPI